MARGRNFRFTLGGVDHKLGKLDNKVEGALVAVSRFYSAKAEAWMKHGAPWQDRTTNARNGLFSEPFHEGSRIGYVLAHSVDYGIFLERGTEDMAARPIIVPALGHWGPRTMKKVARLMDRLR